MAATNLPWTGATYRATATGMPQQAVAFSVMGFGAQSTPLGIDAASNLTEFTSTNALQLTIGAFKKGAGAIRPTRGSS
ncbi:MAG: hypothetical protein AB8H80_15195 [Planctomycetota bacterium]